MRFLNGGKKLHGAGIILCETTKKTITFQQQKTKIKKCFKPSPTKSQHRRIKIFKFFIFKRSHDLLIYALVSFFSAAGTLAAFGFVRRLACN